MDLSSADISSSEMSVVLEEVGMSSSNGRGVAMPKARLNMSRLRLRSSGSWTGGSGCCVL